MRKKSIDRIVSFLIILVLLVCALPVSALAAEKGQVVVVGACPDCGVSVSGSTYTGFAYDYLREISKFTGHKYSFVEAERDELIEMLYDGRIDILPCVSEEEFNVWQKEHSVQDGAAAPTLTSIALMKKFTAVYVPDSSEDIAYFDSANINKATVGYLAEDKDKYFLDGKFIRGDIDNAHFVEYSTEVQMHEDFVSGKIDAAVKECFRPWDDETIVYQYDTRDCYFMVSGNDPLLAGQLEVAVNSVYMSNSSFAANLYNKHIAKYGVPKYAYSASEKTFIKNNPEITIAYNLGTGSMEKYDSNTGKLTGATGGVLEAISAHTGMKIRIKACSTLEECVSLLEHGEVRAICGGVNSSSMEPFGKFRVSFPYSTTPVVIAGKAGSNLTSYKKIAIPNSDDDISDYIRQLYDNALMLPYDDVKACMEAVRSGEADVMCASAYETLYLISNGYGDMAVTDISSAFHSECFAYMDNVSADFTSIMGKSISRLVGYSPVISSYESVSAGTVGLEKLSDHTVYVFLFVFVMIAVCVVMVVILIQMNEKRANGVDVLTGGRNKARFIDDARRLLRKTPAEKLAVVLFDINKFKYVNDRLGYEEGDRMLVRLHKTVADNMDDGEIFARLSDDNFACVIKNAQDSEITARFNNIFAEFERRNSLFVKYPVVFSAGVCRLGQCRDGGKDIDLNIAIDRCKIAKRTLKGLHYSSIAFYDGKIREKALREKDYESIMPTALEQREFECYLQPKYGLKSRHIEGAEALIRWNSKEFGFVFPNEFIPLSEKNGFVVELDFFILEEVCRAMRRWIDDGKKPVVISVNQSRLHLNYDDYIWRLREIVDKYEIPYEYIELELTESVFIENSDKLLTIMQKLHDIGFKLSLDDFGSGYSSLNMLKDIPVDVVKIDREFFNGTVNSEKGRAVISTVVDLAKNLNMEVISEGVETLEQVEFLTEINCAMVQGYYFAKPMNMQAFEELWNKDMEQRSLEALEAADATSDGQN